MITRRSLEILLQMMTGKLYVSSRQTGKRTMTQIEQSLKVYLDRGEFNLNLDGEELYQNAKECLELAGYEVEA
jgi:hypothetical protein